jgi:hypothetical protein
MPPTFTSRALGESAFLDLRRGNTLVCFSSVTTRRLCGKPMAG